MYYPAKFISLDHIGIGVIENKNENVGGALTFSRVSYQLTQPPYQRRRSLLVHSSEISLLNITFTPFRTTPNGQGIRLSYGQIRPAEFLRPYFNYLFG